MHKLKSKLPIGSGNKIKGADGNGDLIEIAALQKLFSSYEKHMNSVTNPGHGFHIGSGKTSKKGQNNYPETAFADYLSKHNVNINGQTHNALQYMSDAFRQIGDYKSQRDSSLGTDVYTPIEGVLEDIKKVNTAQKEVIDTQNQLAAANKKQEKNSDQQSEARRAKALQDNEAAKSRRDNAIRDFKSTESVRIKILLSNAETLQEYHRQVADSLSKLVSDLKNIEGNASSSYNGLSNEINEYQQPDTSSFGFTKTADYTPAKNDTASKQYRAIYDFEAQEEDDLDLKQGDIVKVIKQTDENWYYGEKDGIKGHFPVDYVKEL